MIATMNSIQWMVAVRSTTVRPISVDSNPNLYSIVCRWARPAKMTWNQNSTRVLFVNCPQKKKSSKHKAAIQHPELVIVVCLALCWVHYRNFAKKNHDWSKKKRKRHRLRKNWKSSKCKSARIWSENVRVCITIGSVSNWKSKCWKLKWIGPKSSQCGRIRKSRLWISYAQNRGHVFAICQKYWTNGPNDDSTIVKKMWRVSIVCFFVEFWKTIRADYWYNSYGSIREYWNRSNENYKYNCSVSNMLNYSITPNQHQHWNTRNVRLFIRFRPPFFSLNAVNYTFTQF